MRRRVTKALFTAAAAGATITSLGFAAAVPASAAQGPTVTNFSSGGWAAGNVLAPTPLVTGTTWRFRYASGTTVLPTITGTVPPAPDLHLNFAQQAFSVQLSDMKATYAAQMIATTTGVWSVQFVRYYQDTVLPAGDVTGTSTATSGCNPTTGTPWTAGTKVRLDLFYNQNDGTITFTAYSGSTQVCQQTVAAWVAGTLGGGPFTEAYTGGVFTTATTGASAQNEGDPYLSGLPATATWTRPTVNRSLFPVSATRFTSYNGTMGSVEGPWSFQELAFASSAANTFADPGLLWDGSQNFGVWLRA